MDNIPEWGWERECMDAFARVSLTDLSKSTGHIDKVCSITTRRSAL